MPLPASEQRPLLLRRLLEGVPWQGSNQGTHKPLPAVPSDTGSVVREARSSHGVQHLCSRVSATVEPTVRPYVVATLQDPLISMDRT